MLGHVSEPVSARDMRDDRALSAWRTSMGEYSASSLDIHLGVQGYAFIDLDCRNPIWLGSFERRDRKWT
jgi:hypothetical protein